MNEKYRGGNKITPVWERVGNQQIEIKKQRDPLRRQLIAAFGGQDKLEQALQVEGKTLDTFIGELLQESQTRPVVGIVKLIRIGIRTVATIVFNPGEKTRVGEIKIEPKKEKFDGNKTVWENK